MQKTKYINDLENVIMAWALRGEEPALYHTMRFVTPKLMRGFDVSLKNVVDYGTSAATRAKEKKIKRENVISGMISASQDEGTTLTDSALGAQASALIVAGSGTTAVTLTYAIWAILSHAGVRSKLEGEVSSIPENYNDTLLEKLPYLKAVILETLRLYGAAPGSLPRVTPEKGIQVKGFFVPAGITMTTQAYTMHRDPAIFPDPER
jgi:cytochrome P450